MDANPPSSIKKNNNELHDLMDSDSHAYIHQGPIVARVPVTLCKCRVTYDVTFTYYTYIETAWLIPVSNM